VRVFTCGQCFQLVFFENWTCLRCGAELGFSPQSGTLFTLEGDGETWSALRGGPDAPRWRRCANAEIAHCNWLVPAAEAGLCFSCQLTTARPNDADAEGVRAFQRAESAKRRLVFQLLALGLPVASRRDDPDGIAFELLWVPGGGVVTGHEGGVITLDLTESDDARRERLRVELGEPYRTVLGHFRHEIGHYYWERLVPREVRDAFRALFGDEGLDYGASLSRHYAEGPPPGWQEGYVSAYATMHPFEDWAETFAHYLHLADVLETAASVGMDLALPGGGEGRARPAEALAGEDFDELLRHWVPLTVGLNAVSRSMGKDDLYPFVLPPLAMEKLRFVHQRIRAAGGAR